FSNHRRRLVAIAEFGLDCTAWRTINHCLCLRTLAGFFIVGQLADSTPDRGRGRLAYVPGSHVALASPGRCAAVVGDLPGQERKDRKSTRLNSSHVKISYAVFCLKKKKNKKIYHRQHIRYCQHS